MRSDFVSRFFFAIACGVAARWADGAINLEWRPLHQDARVGDTIHVALFAVSDRATPQSFINLGVLLRWDPSRLELLGLDDSSNGYHWLLSFFPNDTGLDKLNADCTANDFCPTYTGLPFNDGFARYEAFAGLPPAAPPEASSTGLRVTEFRFRAVGEGRSEVSFSAFAGIAARTRVIGTVIVGEDVTGQLGSPAIADLDRMTMEDLSDLATCLRGPGAIVAGNCRRFDVDRDGDVDLRDVADVQDAYSLSDDP